MSEKQIQANRANARKSTGPKTAAGKRAIARNGLKHGILSRALFLEDEDPEEFETLRADLDTALRPSGALELALVETIKALKETQAWRLETLEVTPAEPKTGSEGSHTTLSAA